VPEACYHRQSVPICLTKLAQQEKDEPSKVTRDGFDAMMKGDRSIINGCKIQEQSRKLESRINF
jgi:hypothetical protein